MTSVTVSVLLATWALAKKGWLTRRREGLFYRSVVILSFASILPTLLSTRALAGPLEAQAARFADLGGTDNYLAFTTIGIVGAAALLFGRDGCRVIDRWTVSRHHVVVVSRPSRWWHWRRGGSA